MEYNWDKKKLEALKKEYIYLKRHTSGLQKEDKTAIKKKLNFIEEMEDILYLPKEKDFPFHLPENYVDKTKFLPKSTLEDYQKVPPFIRKWILNAMHAIYNYKSLPEKQTLPKFKWQDKELVELAHDFFTWLPNKKYVQIADRYMDKNENLLRIQKNSYNDYCGSTFTFSYPVYTPYFVIEKQNTINDFCTLNHEIAHGIFYASDSNISTSNNHQYLLELEGYFFDFLSFEFLKEKKVASLKTIKKAYFNEFIGLLDENFIYFYFQYLAILLYKEHKKIEIESVNQKLLEQEMPFEINEYFLLLYLQEDSKHLAKYALSGLVNTDLEKMYSYDREYAFYQFEHIRYNKTNDIEKNLREHGITFMEDHYQNLQEKVKKLSLMKK